ncbi:response regulator transcription factor [Dyadobacter sp. CY347]|uniref:response regulator n=1 Tax=Dyadobacter sp. CY347 TaxID=2909336 RepID=UPI001F3FF938|nr:response regulator transcription factor [Dyadobacter sp. CY347]MCF2488117.1 response regulator transcription factor [Dyadobacter sp. CY347]
MKILHIDDHPLIRMGLELLIKEIYPDSEVVQAIDFTKGMEAIKSQSFSLIILDIGIPGGKNLEMIKKIRGYQPNVSILIYSGYDEQLYGLSFIRAGADGFLSKNSTSAQIKTAIKMVAEKEKYFSPELRESLIEKLLNKETGTKSILQTLSPVELRVTQLLVEGYWNRDIARLLDLKSSTVSTFKQRIFAKLGVKDVIQLAALVNATRE